MFRLYYRVFKLIKFCYNFYTFFFSNFNTPIVGIDLKRLENMNFCTLKLVQGAFQLRTGGVTMYSANQRSQS